MIGRRKLYDPSLIHIFNALSIGVQYTLSFQGTNFDLKCLLKLICLTILVTRKPLTQFWPKIRGTKSQKSVKIGHNW